MNSVIIPAGGSGSRYSKNSIKLLEPIHQKPILYWTVLAFFNHPLIDEIIIPCAQKNHDVFLSVLSPFQSKVTLTPGGTTRSLSVYSGFKACHPNTKNILIHDAARPNISAEFITLILSELDHHPVVIPGLPVTDTLKQVVNQTIQKTIDRDQLFRVQTPQGVQASVLQDAYTKITDISAHTDEASLLESIHIFGHIVPGSEHNIKLTHPNDLLLLEALFNQHQSFNPSRNVS